MKVYERVNLYLKDKNINKIEFYKKLLELEPKLESTGEPPSQTSVYAYLNGQVAIRIELVPYIAQVLEVPEQLLFADSPHSRKLYIRHIKDTMTQDEVDIWHSDTHPETKTQDSIDYKRFDSIHDMLQFAPDMFLKQLENTLKDYKSLTLKFRQ
ncbi:MAG: hypothetical protein DRG11_02025 [Epsilonproteobacteria bacterium]|nr:MAG: hypothetical protein DRG11_02025 [Campylobacterota bacterium]